MRRPDENRYIYSASANSAAAAIHNPLKAFLTDAPSATIPVTGGLNAHSRERFSLRIDASEIVRIGYASASVLGEHRGDHYITQATASVENLNILNVVTADRIVAKVTSVYYPKEFADKDPDYHCARFYVTGSYFDNLRINGKLINFQPKEVEDEKGLTLRYSERHHGQICHDNRHHVHEFGTVYLGEKSTYGGKLILNMLRVELGCTVEGNFSCSNATSNGSHTKAPPPPNP